MRAPRPARSHCNGKATAQFTSHLNVRSCILKGTLSTLTTGEQGTLSPHPLLLGSMEPLNTHGSPGHQSPLDTGKSGLPRPGAQAQCFCFLLRACLLCPAMDSPGHSPGHHRKPLGLRHPIQISLHLTSPLEKMPDSVGSKHTPLLRPSGCPPKSAQGFQASQILRRHRHTQDKELQPKGLCQERNGQPRRLMR